MFEEVKPLQEKQLEILKEFDRVCTKNNIKYYLAFGTLLGAIRHEGFIPWDDDVDTCVNYRDYIRLDRICKRDCKENYFLQSYKSDPETHMTYKKLRLSTTTLIVDYMADKDCNHGINIDVYPIFHVADNAIMRKIQILSAIMYLTLESAHPAQNHGRLMKWGSAAVLALIKGKTREKIKRRCHRFMVRYEDKETGYRALFYGNARNCLRIYKAKYFEGEVRKKFVDTYFPVPSNYDEFLKIRYGADYMQLPPEEMQGVKLDHIVKIDTEVPYKEYKGKLYCVGRK